MKFFNRDGLMPAIRSIAFNYKRSLKFSIGNGICYTFSKSSEICAYEISKITKRPRATEAPFLSVATKFTVATCSRVDDVLKKKKKKSKRKRERGRELAGISHARRDGISSLVARIPIIFFAANTHSPRRRKGFLLRPTWPIPSREKAPPGRQPRGNLSWLEFRVSSAQNANAKSLKNSVAAARLGGSLGKAIARARACKPICQFHGAAAPKNGVGKIAWSPLSPKVVRFPTDRGRGRRRVIRRAFVPSSRREFRSFCR